MIVSTYLPLRGAAASDVLLSPVLIEGLGKLKPYILEITKNSAPNSRSIIVF